MDPFEEIGMAEKKAEQHRRSANEKEVQTICGLYMLNFCVLSFVLVVGLHAFESRHTISVLSTTCRHIESYRTGFWKNVWLVAFYLTCGSSFAIFFFFNF